MVERENIIFENNNLTVIREGILVNTLTNPGQVGTIDITTGNYIILFSNGPELTDIALSEDQNLFGITFSELYSLDLAKNTSTLIGNLGFNGVNALGFDANNILYGATNNGNFLRINPNTGVATLVANIPGFSSGGDLVFNPETNQFFATSNTPNDSTLFSIALDGTATEIGAIGFDDVFGLSLENETLFGYTADRQKIQINPETGSGTFDTALSNTNLTIGGATSLPFSSTNLALGLDIDGNNTIDALTDGILILRYMFGFRGDSLINDAVADDCLRCNLTEIQNFIEEIT